MTFKKMLLLMFTVAITLVAAPVNGWEGVVNFYRRTNFGTPDFPWFVNTEHRCYNLSCFNDKVSSVKWEGLPQKGSFSGKARIAFYKNANCTGTHREWTTDATNFPVDLSLDGINDAISSFMILTDGDKIKHGIELPCPWNVK